ncbi:unnamed protein product [Sphenostylis stenocarpa]|uniref:DNA polymerase n=1 Tax=Sphenostylis stenocarpa TaxID=92480 RepID=A0AA86VPP2_9FABA|nr:unnamed protein product [Sphenostylis stenocarpa]
MTKLVSLKARNRLMHHNTMLHSSPYLSLPYELIGTDSGVDTYFGFCTYPGRELRHRIDLKVYPRDIYAFGLIAWTGNDVLNRRLRLVAESKGFRLDDTGLFPATHGSGSKRGAKGSASLKFDTEKEVFDFLDFPWLEPHERNL